MRVRVSIPCHEPNTQGPLKFSVQVPIGPQVNFMQLRTEGSRACSGEGGTRTSGGFPSAAQGAFCLPSTSSTTASVLDWKSHGVVMED